MKKFMILAICASGFVLLAQQSVDAKHMRDGKMFEKRDLNKDGVISKAEFLEVAEKKFHKIDADNDGNITKEEARLYKQKKKEKMKKHHDHKSAE